MNPNLKRAMDSLEARGRALSDLIAVSDPARKDRAVETASRISNMKENRDEITARVKARTDSLVIRPAYGVAIQIDGSRVVGHRCTCPDHGTSGACKHVIAVANRWIVEIGRPTYVALRNASRVAA